MPKGIIINTIATTGKSYTYFRSIFIRTILPNFFRGVAVIAIAHDYRAPAHRQLRKQCEYTVTRT